MSRKNQQNQIIHQEWSCLTAWYVTFRQFQWEVVCINRLALAVENQYEFQYQKQQPPQLCKKRPKSHHSSPSSHRNLGVKVPLQPFVPEQHCFSLFLSSLKPSAALLQPAPLITEVVKRTAPALFKSIPEAVWALLQTLFQSTVKSGEILLQLLS